jgi:AcrR family transcriptional regulator
MVAKTQFTKEQIIDAAFDIARTEGLDRITVRKVADKLGSSIAPIYVNFQHIDELVQAVVQKTFEVAQRLLAEQDSGSPFFDMGVASLRFANEYSHLFRDLTLKPNQYMQNYDQEMGPVLLEQMKKDQKLAGFTDQELMEILLKMRIFQLGLSTMVANRLLPKDFDEEKTIELLDSTATDVIAGARHRKNQS